MNITDEQKVNIQKRLCEILKEYDSTKESIDNDFRVYEDKISNLPKFIESMDVEFEKLTNITQKDISFLVFASTLQVARQWITSNLKKRLSDKKSAENTPFHTDEHSDRRVK